MTKSELITAVAVKSDRPATEVREIVNCMFDEIGRKLAKGEEVTLSGFGRFEVRKRAANQYTNPKTGEKTFLDGTVTPGFKSSGKLRRLIREAQEEE